MVFLGYIRGNSYCLVKFGKKIMFIENIEVKVFYFSKVIMILLSKEDEIFVCRDLGLIVKS